MSSSTEPESSSPDSPVDGAPPAFLLAAARSATQSRTSSSSTLVPMQHLYPALPNGVGHLEPTAADYRFPRSTPDPHNHPRRNGAAAPDLVADTAAAASPSSSSPSSPRVGGGPLLPPSTAAGHSPERSPSLQERRRSSVQGDGLPGLTCVVDSVAHALGTPEPPSPSSLGVETLALGSPAAMETPSAARSSFVVGEAATTPARQEALVLDRTPRPSPTVVSAVDPLASTTVGQQHAERDGSSEAATGASPTTARSDSWDSAIPEGTPWSRLQLQFHDARHQSSSFSQSASIGSTHVTTPDSEDPHHHYGPAVRGVGVGGAHHAPHGQHHQPYPASQFGPRVGAGAYQALLPPSGQFQPDGLPVFSPSPYFKEIVSAHTAGSGERPSQPPAQDAVGMPLAALSQSPPHRMDTAALFAHYQSAAHKAPAPARTEGFFDYGARQQPPAAATAAPRASHHNHHHLQRSPSQLEPTPRNGTNGGGGAKQRSSGADATLGSSAFAPGLRKRLEQIMERVSDRLDWQKAGGDGVITIGACACSVSSLSRHPPLTALDLSSCACLQSSTARRRARPRSSCARLSAASARWPARRPSSWCSTRAARRTCASTRRACTPTAATSARPSSTASTRRSGTASLPTRSSSRSRPSWRRRGPSTSATRSPTSSGCASCPSLPSLSRALRRQLTVPQSSRPFPLRHSPRPSALNMSAAADKELRDFLCARSREFRPEGILVLAFVMSNSKQPQRNHSTSSASSPQASTFRGAPPARTDRNGSLPYPSNEPTLGSKQRAGSLSDSPLAAGSDVWRQIASVLAVCITRLVSIGSIRSAVAPLLTAGLPLWPRSSAELRSSLAAADVADAWDVVQSHGLSDEDDSSMPDDDGPFSVSPRPS